MTYKDKMEKLQEYVQKYLENWKLADNEHVSSSAEYYAIDAHKAAEKAETMMRDILGVG